MRLPNRRFVLKQLRSKLSNIVDSDHWQWFVRHVESDRFGLALPMALGAHTEADEVLVVKACEHLRDRDTLLAEVLHAYACVYIARHACEHMHDTQ